MIQTIENIILGMIANGLTALIAYIGGEEIKTLKHEKSLRQRLETNATLAPILQKATIAAAKALKLDDKSQLEKLRFFLASPDVDTIIRQIYSTRLTTHENSNHLKSIREEFLTCLSLHIGESHQQLDNLGERLFDCLLKGCDLALAIAIEKGVLSAHEAKSAFRYRILLDELATIERNIVFLKDRHRLDIGAIPPAGCRSSRIYYPSSF